MARGAVEFVTVETSGSAQPGSGAGSGAGYAAAGEDRARVSAWAVALAVLLTVAAGLAVSYGLARDDRLWLVAGAVVFAPVLVASAHGAAGAVEESRRTAGVAGFAAIAILFIVVIVVSQPWWDEQGGLSGKELFVAAADPTAHVYLHKTPGGAELTRRRDPKPLVAATAYRFDCEVKLADGTLWFQLSGTDYWAPQHALLSKQGTAAPRLPTC